MKRLLTRVFLFGLPVAAIYYGFFSPARSQPPHPGKVADNGVQVSERLPKVKLERLPPIDFERIEGPTHTIPTQLELVQGPRINPVEILEIEQDTFASNNTPSPIVLDSNAVSMDLREPIKHAEEKPSTLLAETRSADTTLLDLASTDRSQPSFVATITSVDADEPTTNSSLDKSIAQHSHTSVAPQPIPDISAEAEPARAQLEQPTSTSLIVRETVVPPTVERKVAKREAPTSPPREGHELLAAPSSVAPAELTPHNTHLPAPAWSPVDLREIVVNPEMEPALTNGLPMGPRGQQQALEAVQLGFELVQRGAPFSARARFVEALRIVARSLDAKNRTKEHSLALTQALNAYEEAGEFFPNSSHPDESVRVEFVVGGHHTRVLQAANVDVRQLTPEQCVREYVAYAEQEFAKALGQESIGSQALYGLGRLEWAKTTTPTHSKHVRTFRAMSLYQAAMTINPENYAAANELGVLLAKNGNYRDAIAALNHSVQYSPQPTAFRNLASLYRRTGQIDQAKQAEYLAMRSAPHRETPFVAANPRVEWVEPHEFAGVAVGQPYLQTARKTSPRSSSAPHRPAATTTHSDETPIRTSARPNLRRWPFGRSVSR